MSRLEEAKKQIVKWKEDPVCFVREVFSVEPDPWQVDVLEAFPKNKRIAMKASKGPGKTAVLAWLAWNFLATRLHPKIPATSISERNLNDNLWPEMAKWQNNSKFLKEKFVWTKTRIFAKDHPETWFMSLRSWSRSADSSQQSNTLAGIHADNVLFILDEVGGIPDSVMAAAEAGLATGIDTKIIMAGNPTHRSGPLYKACTTERKLWKVIEITSDPDDPKRSPRVSPDWAREQIEKYGRDNPWVLVNVFGKFPPSSINSLIGPDEVFASMKRSVFQDDIKFSQKRLGVDVARFGNDRTVIFPRQGLVAFKPVEMRNVRSHDIAARVMKAKYHWGSEVECIDGTGGYGSGVVDSMIQAGQTPLEINFAGKSISPKYANKRSEMWFLMIEWIKRGGCLPNIDSLVAELTAPTYTFINGKFFVEKKEQIKERLGFSPDLADALCLTFSLPEETSRDSRKYFSYQKKTEWDYNPYTENTNEC